MSRPVGWRILLVLAALGGAAALIAIRPPRLGLDLRGGTQILLEARDTPRQRVNDDTVGRTLEVLRRRVDQLGVSEPNLQRTGSRRIIVELPGLDDPDEALEVIGRTAQLEFRPVAGLAEQPSPGSTETDSDPETLIVTDEEGGSLRLGPAVVTGAEVSDAQAVIDPQTGGWHVEIDFRRDGSAEWADLTGRAACAPPGDPTRRVAIVLDNEAISSPQVSEEVTCNEGITGGETVITGGFTEDEAKDLALLIRAGALPVPVEVVERTTVGPTLGEQAIDTSVKAALIGAALTAIYMLAYYRFLGFLAVLGLVAYGALSFGALVGIGATLTLPGIAGFVLAVGMAVDANVLTFERMKEEHASGKRLHSAALEGFRRAWSAIADSNATTLLAALLLFFLASGPVRGFGVTLSLGVIVSMFSALVVVKLFVDLAARPKLFQTRPGFLGLTVGGKLRQRLVDSPPDIVGRRKIWFAVSLVVVVAALAGLFSRGLNYGLEFTGGRLIEFETQREVDLSRLRTELAGEGFPRALIQETGEGNISVRSGRLTAEEEANVTSAVSRIGGDAQKVRDEFVGPTLGEELRRKALIALLLALTAQLLYLAVRFRWNYGLSAVAAMFHDVLILLGIFAWMGKQIDGVFLAALLTVIGYSINDSVVVFDRIREQWRLRARDAFSEVANDAALQTIPRTINTGLGAMFILAALFFLGGETLTDFALALIIGIAVGTYSSVFTAAPLCVVIDRMRPAPSPSPRSRTRSSQARARARAYARGRGR
jgi:SecD/SecF fusion protein